MVDRGVTQGRYWDFFVQAYDSLQGKLDWIRRPNPVTNHLPVPPPVAADNVGPEILVKVEPVREPDPWVMIPPPLFSVVIRDVWAPSMDVLTIETVPSHAWPPLVTWSLLANAV